MKHAFFDICREPDHVLFQYPDSAVRFEEPSSREERTERIGFALENGALAVTLYPNERPYNRVKLRWDGDLSSGILCLGDGWERQGLSTMANLECAWTGIEPRRRMPWYFHLYDGAALHSFGVRTGPAVFVWFECDPKGISMWIDARSGGQPITLLEPLLACEVVCREGRDGEVPYRAAEAFCRMMCEKPNLPKAPIFGVNNWYWAYGEITHDIVMDECSYLMEMAADAVCRPHMIIDDGWQLNRYSNRLGAYNGGPWDKTNAGFADMAKTADAIHEMGANAGIWLRPLLTCLPVPQDALGIRKCEGGGLILDPSHPYTLELVREDVARIRSWGYDLIKHDFTTYDTVRRVFDVNAGLPAFYDKHHPTAYIMRELYRTIEDAAGGATVIGCNTFGHLAAGIHAVQRVGDDTSGRNWEVTRSDGIATLVRLPQNNTFFSHDPDCAAFTDMVPHDANLDFLEAAAITGATTLASVTPHILSAASMARIRSIYKVASQGGLGAMPEDWLGHHEPSVFTAADGRRFAFDWYGIYNGARTFYTWSN